MVGSPAGRGSGSDGGLGTTAPCFKASQRPLLLVRTLLCPCQTFLYGASDRPSNALLAQRLAAVRLQIPQPGTVRAWLLHDPSGPVAHELWR